MKKNKREREEKEEIVIEIERKTILKETVETRFFFIANIS